MSSLNHVRQINDQSCVHACLAMLNGKSVEEMWDRYPFPLTPKEELTILIESRLWPVCQQQFANQFPLCGVYLVSVPSLNVAGANHRVVVTVGEADVVCYDPQNGREGKKFYSMDAFQLGSETPVKSYSEVTRIDNEMLSDLFIAQGDNHETK